MKLIIVEVGTLYHIVDTAKNCIVAIITANPWAAEWIAKQPRTNKILAKDQRFNDLIAKMGVKA